MAEKIVQMVGSWKRINDSTTSKIGSVTKITLEKEGESTYLCSNGTKLSFSLDRLVDCGHSVDTTGKYNMYILPSDGHPKILMSMGPGVFCILEKQ
jgi:hypothetical protein